MVAVLEIPQVEMLAISQLCMTGGTQPRAKVDEALVGVYAERVLAGDKFPPVKAVTDGKLTWPWDGFHTLLAYKKAGKATVPCEVSTGVLDEARWLAASANKTHGRQRTDEDIAGAVAMALATGRGRHLSDQEIADHIGVDRKTVAKHRPAEKKTGFAKAGRTPTNGSARLGSSQPHSTKRTTIQPSQTTQPSTNGHASNGKVPKVSALPPDEQEDELGVIVPKRLLVVFAKRQDFIDIGRKISEVCKMIDLLAESPAGAHMKNHNQLIHTLKTVSEDVINSRPALVDPDSKTGWLPARNLP